MLKGVNLRKHPYPFRCSLAICSDIDRCSFEDFVKLHKFLNTKEETPFGKGLELEIGDSFWMYSAGSQTDEAFSYFKGLTNEPSQYAEFIREGIKAGYLDCLHAYGHFCQYAGFKRNMAETALKELEGHGLKVKVWSNHGGVHNLQNILVSGFGDLPADIHASGDSTPSEEYHTDVTLRHGICFAWIGENTDLIGQDRKYGFSEYLLDTIRLQGFKSGILLCLRAVIHKILRRSILPPSAQDNHLLRIQPLRDDSKIFTFRRFLPEHRWGRDFGDDLRYALSKDTLSQLEKNNGFMVVYVHLGKKRIPNILSSETIECLRDLQCRSKLGKIWVATTSKLLTYNWISRFLSWDSISKSGDIIITIRGVEDPLKGFSMPTVDDCQGLTWYTPIPERTRVFLLTGQELRLVINPEDGSGKRTVSVPIESLNPTEWVSLHQS